MAFEKLVNNINGTVGAILGVEIKSRQVTKIDGQVYEGIVDNTDDAYECGVPGPDFKKEITVRRNTIKGRVDLRANPESPFITIFV